MILKTGRYELQIEHIVSIERDTDLEGKPIVKVRCSDGANVLFIGEDLVNFSKQWEKVATLDQVLAENQAIQLQMQQQVAQAVQAKQAYEQALQKSGPGRILIPH